MTISAATIEIVTWAKIESGNSVAAIFPIHEVV
jgi:hypothetical protein